MDAVFILEADDDGAGGGAFFIDVGFGAGGGEDFEGGAVAPVHIIVGDGVAAGIGDGAEGEGIGGGFIDIGVAGEGDRRRDVAHRDGSSVAVHRDVIIKNGEGDDVNAIVGGGEREVGGGAGGKGGAVPG